MKAFAENLRKVRLAHSLTQEQAAQALGIKVRTYQAYEGGRAEPRTAGMLEMSRTFGVTNLHGFFNDPNFSWSNQGESIKANNNLVMQFTPVRGPYKPRTNICGS